MSTSTTTVVSNGDVDFYFTGVNLAFLRALKGNNRALYPKFAYVPPAGIRSESKYPIDLPSGEQVIGTRVKFPISLAASRPEIWPYGTPRKVEPFSQIEVSVDMQRWAPPSKREQWDVFTNDKFGIIKDQLPQMMDRAQILWDMVLAETIAGNAANAAYDNLPFFTPAATPHEANPLKPGVANFYNDVPITGIDVPNMRFLLGLLENAPGPDGLPLDTDEVDIIALAPTSDLKFQLNQVFNAAIAAQAVGANAAAGVSNALLGAARVELFKQLARTKTQPIFAGKAQDRTQIGYLMAVPKNEGRPIALVPNRHPTAYYTGLNGSDHLRARLGAMEYGWDAYGQGKLVIPQRMIRFLVNPVI